jgi:hypothetical protein
MGGEHASAAVDQESGTEFGVEFLLNALTFPNNPQLLNDPNVWIADSGATVHMSPYKIGMRNLRKATVEDAITMGNKRTVYAREFGDIPVRICDKEGNDVIGTTITNVGCKDKITLQKDQDELTFDIEVRTTKGVLYAIYMKRTLEIAGAATDTKKMTMTITQAHGKLGHCNDATRKVAEQLGWKLKPGTLKSCKACAAAKAKQKDVPQVSEGKPVEDGKNCIYLDIAMLKQRKGMPRATKPNWRIMVNQQMGLKFSNFFDTKNGMVEPTCEQIHQWKQNGITVDYIRLNNVGENKLLKQRCHSKDWKFEQNLSLQQEQHHSKMP